MKWKAVFVVLTLAAAACGSDSPSGPDDAPLPADAVTINVVAQNGAQSFSPNPATVPAGHTVIWHNIDNVTHRVVLNDGTIDTGDLAPGAFSRAMTLTNPGAYKCSIHPSMVGTIAR